MKTIISLIVILISISVLVESRNDRIKLKDIEVLTLKSGQWTTGRRSKAVPQLQCVGGLCSQFKPLTVQCYNKGSDGIDIQWECKTDMNNRYKWGTLDVICEGYDYSDDDYVLKGSCGLEYTIESTDSNSYHSNDYKQEYKQKANNSFSFAFILCVIFVSFIIYYTCLRPTGSTSSTNNRSNTNRSNFQSPPPPGFRPDFSGEGCGTSSSYSSQTRYPNTGESNSSGFWSGMMTGGTLGYLFGSRTNQTNYNDQTSYFGTRTRSPPPYFSTQSSDTSNSRSTSGFAGTKRR